MRTTNLCTPVLSRAPTAPSQLVCVLVLSRRSGAVTASCVRPASLQTNGERAITNHDTSYERYRRNEAELIERLDARRRAADEAAQSGRGFCSLCVPAASSTSSNPTCATFADTGSDRSEGVELTPRREIPR